MNNSSKKKKYKHKNSYARKIALEAIYQVEVGAKNSKEILVLDWIEEKIKPSIKNYAIELILGSLEKKEKNKVTIQKYSHKDYTQISIVIRSLLQLAFWELQSQKEEVPIIIDEILELVREYDGEESVAFVNGILDAFHKAKNGL